MNSTGPPSGWAGWLSGHRALQLVAPFVALGAVAWMSTRQTKHEEELAAVQSAAERALHARQAPRTVYYVDKPQKRSGEPEVSPSNETAAREEPERDDDIQDEEPTLEERELLRVQRYEHIMGAFEGQNPMNYEPERAGCLTDALHNRLRALTLPRGIEFGEVECRGRMCAFEVRFDGPDELRPLREAAQAAVVDAVSQGHPPPLVHLVTRSRPDGRDGDAGRFFFEWIQSEPEAHSG